MTDKNLLTPPPILEHFGLGSFVCLDFETTGLAAATNDIIEIGAVKVVTGNIATTFHSFVAIVGELPEAITTLTGISQEDLAGQPAAAEILPQLVDFIGEAPVVAHNLSFDLGFLQESLTRLGDFSNANRFRATQAKHWDILLLARVLLPGLRSHRLSAMIEALHLESDTQHRALADALAEVQIFDRLLLHALRLSNETLVQLVGLTQSNYGNIAYFFRALHDLRIKKRQLVNDNQLTGFLLDYPASQNILPRKNLQQNGELPFFEPNTVSAIFAAEGKLAQALSGYELREEQIEMVESVCRAYEKEEFLMIEAGTGTGKSWAYLAPAIYWSQAHPAPAGRTVVSTNTKNLQEQIFYKDLPFLYQHLPVDFQAVLLKGRANYLCLNRWHKFLAQIDFFLDTNLLEEVLPLIVWQNETKTGDIEEVGSFSLERSGKIWWQIHSDGHYCRGQSCAFKEQCFVNRVRRAGREADLVVVNHSLLLSDLIADNAVLSEYQNLIIDEAHNLENTATQYLGKDWTFWSLHQLASSLDSTGSDNRNEMALLAKLLQRQTWLESGLAATLTANFEQIQATAVELRKANESFFQRVQLELWQVKNRNNGYASKVRYRNWAQEYPNLQGITDELFDALAQLQQEVFRLNNNLVELSLSKFSADDQEHFADGSIFVEGTTVSLQEWQEALQHLLCRNDSSFVFWLEASGHRDNQEIHFHSAPLEVAQLLKGHLYDRLRTAVFTSATLSVNREFDFFEHRLGLDLLPRAKRNSRLVGSPFDFKNQVQVFIPQFMPDPKQSRFVEMSADLIRQTLVTTRRSMLVLFTSYQMLNQVYDRLGVELRDDGLKVVAQGKGIPRNSLLQLLREQKVQALLGTHSFWEGVDLPGEALELLVITKLPFEVPSEPVVQARIELIEQLGGNSFYDYSVPNAVLKFRQGFGRLIRTRQDRGVVLLLDSRLIFAQYREQFLHSLPVAAEIVASADDLITRIQNWFSCQ